MLLFFFREHFESKESRNYFKRIISAVLNAEMYQIFEQVFAAIDLIHIEQRVIGMSLNDTDNQQNKKRAK
jgi:hypothetical protein